MDFWGYFVSTVSAAILIGLPLAALTTRLIVRKLLPEYFAEKGKNLATKEDMNAITHEIERAKIEYARELVVLRAALTKEAEVHRLGFEREFQTLAELWEAVSDMEFAARALRPVMDASRDLALPEKERREKRLKALDAAYGKVWRLARGRQPFYPSEVYEILAEFFRVIRSEALEFQFRSANYGEPGYDPNYYEKVEKNAEVILKLVDNLCNAIRGRIVGATVASGSVGPP